MLWLCVAWTLWVGLRPGPLLRGPVQQMKWKKARAQGLNKPNVQALHLGGQPALPYCFATGQHKQDEQLLLARQARSTVASAVGHCTEGPRARHSRFRPDFASRAPQTICIGSVRMSGPMSDVRPTAHLML